MADKKEISLSPSFTALLKPTADYLGQEIKNYVQEKIEAKKQKNIRDHLSSVQEKLVENNQQEPTIEQLEFFSDWIDGVENIDPQDKELSEIWENLLIAMTKNNSKTSLLISKLKELDPEDVLVLLKFGRKIDLPLTREDVYRIKKLETLDLLESNELGILYIKFILVLPIIILFFSLVEFDYVSHIKEALLNAKDYPKNFVPFFTLIIPLLVYTVFMLFFKKKLNEGSIFKKITKRLTWLGIALVKLK